MDLVLRVPRQFEEAEFLRAHKATSPSAPNFLHYYKEGMSFRRYLEVLAEQERGEHLTARQVPATFLFAFAGTSIVGRVSIQLARQKLGLTRVLLTCDDDNVGSIRTIEKNGGVLESIVAGPHGGKPKRRYWIATNG